MSALCGGEIGAGLGTGTFEVPRIKKNRLDSNRCINPLSIILIKQTQSKSTLKSSNHKNKENCKHKHMPPSLSWIRPPSGQNVNPTTPTVVVACGGEEATHDHDGEGRAPPQRRGGEPLGEKERRRVAL